MLRTPNFDHELGYAVIETGMGKGKGKGPKPTKVIALAPAPAVQQFNSFFTGTAAEQRALDFFFTRTVPQLSGFFDRNFWSSLVPQLSVSEPAIRYAIIAVGSFHEKTEQVDGSRISPDSSVEVKVYNKALSALVTRLGRDQGSTRITLTACILFICLEFLRGDLDAAMTHIENGIKVLRQSRDRKRQSTNTLTGPSLWESDCTDAELAPMFCVLAFLASLFGRPSLGIYSNSVQEVGSPFPAKYASISKAKIDLFDLFNAIQYFIESVGGARYSLDVGMDEMVEKYRLASRLEAWKEAFEACVETEQGRGLSASNNQAANVLRAGFLGVKIRLAASLEPDEMAWDEYRSEFEEIVLLSEKILISAADSSDKPAVHFSFEPGIISPLHVVAWRCRWPTIRRKALSFLYLHPRREGLHDSRRSFNVLERILLVEELSLCMPPGQEPAWDDLPPEYARIHQVDITCEPATPIGTPVNFISKPNGLLGDWHIRREFIHLGSINIHGNAPKSTWYSPVSHPVTTAADLSHSSETRTQWVICSL
jgi:hypothetical protein